ncbi:hypothetical protein PPYR_13990 [Photinus pyralis]|uniref:C2H2-type domain-containing protein n=2 Tax=Photinus pyralis TaxID=7054 RepID=A0A5N4A432_PHOPY|nr:RE1-silencing transcription factor-like [Photinus pyralis]KAB0792029.1 hypothetical protein PPYR_13990 [Photinus pyralis]
MSSIISNQTQETFDIKIEPEDYDDGEVSVPTVLEVKQEEVEIEQEVEAVDQSELRQPKSEFPRDTKPKNIYRKSKRFSCGRCYYGTPFKHRYLAHVGMCDYLPQIKCEHCNFITRWDHRITRHMRECHRTFECELCSFTATSKHSLSSHLESHKGLLVCEVCNYVTNKKWRFAAHVSSCDIGVAGFKCNQCNYIGRLKTNFNRHVRICHNGP